MKNDYDFLVVYNTCGIRGDKTDHYIHCLRTIIDSKTSFKYKLVMSSCLNQPSCRNRIKELFGDLVEIVSVDKPVTVNVSYNKTCRDMISKYGPFKGYLYLDSGLDFQNNEHALDKAFNSFIANDYGILSILANNDHGLVNSKGASFPVLGQDYLMPLGGSVNGHAELFSHDIFEKYGNLWPDVFAAFCTESTFTFLAASIKKRQAVLKDVALNHAKSVDGASCSKQHVSPHHRNPWNNLLANRDARDFINDKEAIEAGLGYEECNKIMMHKPEAYEDFLPKDESALTNVIKKYLFLSKQELDYDSL